jgi:hypothetical protein
MSDIAGHLPGDRHDDDAERVGGHLVALPLEFRLQAVRSPLGVLPEQVRDHSADLDRERFRLVTGFGRYGPVARLDAVELGGMTVVVVHGDIPFREENMWTSPYDRHLPSVGHPLRFAD